MTSLCAVANVVQGVNDCILCSLTALNC